jgi:chromosome partitioning protein
MQSIHLVGWPNILLANRPTLCYGCRMIIVIANSKGGVGKSTIAVHMCVWLAEQGHSVILADCDRQHSSSTWLKEVAPDIRSEQLSTADDILDNMQALNQQADYVIADAPGSNPENTRSLLFYGEFAFVPCKASMLEVRALSQTTSLLRQVQQIRNGRPFATMILSMVGKHYRLTKDMKDAAEALNMALADTFLTQRQVYADAPGQKAVVWNIGARGRDAAKEMKQLFKEILPFACKTTATKTRKNKPGVSEGSIPEIEYA